MKKLVVSLAVASILVAGAIAYAHGPGYGGWGGGHMMGPGYGGHMMGPMGYGGQGYGHDSKFLDETADLRKELHEKRFEYFEASRNPKAHEDRLTKLEDEIYEIQSKIREKAPQGTKKGFSGYGHCW